MTLMKTIIKIFIIVSLFNAAMFTCFVFLHMTDEALSTFAVLQGNIFKYICGFPLVIFNEDYPYFFNSSHIPNYGWLMIFGNTILQSTTVLLIIKLIRRLKNRV